MEARLGSQCAAREAFRRHRWRWLLGGLSPDRHPRSGWGPGRAARQESPQSRPGRAAYPLQGAVLGRSGAFLSAAPGTSVAPPNSGSRHSPCSAPRGLRNHGAWRNSMNRSRSTCSTWARLAAGTLRSPPGPSGHRYPIPSGVKRSVRWSASRRSSSDMITTVPPMLKRAAQNASCVTPQAARFT
jgi:hypothetical protein